MEKRFHIAVRIGAGAISDDNANVGPQDDTIAVSPLTVGSIIFTELTVAPESQPIDTSGAYASATVEMLYDFGRAGGWGWATDLNYYENGLDVEEEDSRLVKTVFGVKRATKQSLFRGNLYARRIWLGSDPLVDALGVQPVYLRRFKPGGHALYWVSALQVEQRDYDTRDVYDGLYLGLEQTARLMLTDIILAHGGYVDKYEGDAIMAEWGVPFRANDHAVQACLAAVEQQERLARIRPELEKEFGQSLHVRMGINTGTVTAGNMGSDQRFSYTVMGDTVNFASRLEPTNKEYGTSILIGEDTARAAAEAIEVRFVDKIVVQGKTKPVNVYELLGKRGSISDDCRELASLCTEALHLHWERRWENALDRLAQALGIDPEDGPSNTLRTRIIGYQESPPPDDWKGEYVRATKD